MVYFIIGAAIFFTAHFFPRLRAVRGGLIERLGLRGYKIGFSLVSLLGFALMVIGYVNWPYEEVYQPLEGHRALAHALMPIAFILAISADIPSNIKNFARHPLVLATLLWAGIHLTANGDAASLALFGAFGLFALGHIVIVTLTERPSAPPKRPVRNDVIVVAAALIAFGVALWAHGAVFGVYVVG